MSATLTIQDLQPVADLLERVQSVQRAIRDLKDAQSDGVNIDGEAYFSCAITMQPKYDKAAHVANTHGLSYWVVLQGLAAMERELRSQLQNKEICVESALPMAEGA